MAATDGWRPSTDGSNPPADEYDKVIRDAVRAELEAPRRHPVEYMPVQGDN
jgi:hypothetical protein